MHTDDTTDDGKTDEKGARDRFPVSGWIAATAGILGFFVRFSFAKITVEEGRADVFFRDYGAITAGGVALVFGSWALYRILRSPLKKNLGFVLIALFLGVVHLIRGFVAFGAGQEKSLPRMRHEYTVERVEMPREPERRDWDRGDQRRLLRTLPSRHSGDFNQLLSKAEAGDAASQYEVGGRYYIGEGVPKDLDTAFDWIHQAAQGGHVQAMSDLGAFFFEAIGTEKDFREAFEWTQKAAELGNPGGMHNLGLFFMEGVGVEKDAKSAAIWFRKAAEKGHTVAQFKYGVFLAKGIGVEQNLPEAAKWYQKAVDNGDSSAMVNLGIMFLDGTGVQKDAVRAVQLFARAAKEGPPNAHYLLGVCFEDGSGVAKDPVKAREHFQRAADQGFEPAIERLKTLTP